MWLSPSEVISEGLGVVGELDGVATSAVRPGGGSGGDRWCRSRRGRRGRRFRRFSRFRRFGRCRRCRSWMSRRCRTQG